MHRKHRITLTPRQTGSSYEKRAKINRTKT